MNRILSLLLICVFSVSVFADTEGSTAPKQPSPKNTIIALSKRTDNKTARIPSLIPYHKTVAAYDENGIIYVCLTEDSLWEMTIETIDGGTSTYYVSTIDLQQGVYIGILTGFTITLTNNYGITYIGEVYL